MARVGPSPRNSWRSEPSGIVLARDRSPARPVELPAEPVPVTLDAARSACVVVDMQNDFCTPGGWLDHIGVDVAPARAPIGTLVALLPELRRAGIPVIWLNWGNRADRANLPPGVIHVYDPDGTGTGIGDPLPGSGSHVLEKGSWSAQVVDELAVADGDIMVDKFRMSGFFDSELDSVLRNLDATTVLFAGVNVDQCVLATLSDAACLGYDVILLEDCAATTSPGFCVEATLYNVRQCYGFVARGRDLAAALAGGATVANGQ